MKLVIIDYGLCNLLSVYNAVKHLGYQAIVSHDPLQLKQADAVILPGVGAFGDGMRGLNEKGFIEPIQEFVKSGKPFLGICLGMQMLLSKSHEFGEYEGLNLIEGEVFPLNQKIKHDEHRFKIPHIGWNRLQKADITWDHTILNELNEDEMYFVHSFYAQPHKRENVLAETEYGGFTFASIVARDNVYGCQFHPEKSSKQGLRILDNFIQLKATGVVI